MIVGSTSIPPHSELEAGTRQPLDVHSLLGKQVLRVLSSDRKFAADSASVKTLRCFLYVFGAALSTTSCVVPTRIALSYDNGNGSARVLQIVGIVGVMADFDLFGTWGYVLLARQLLQYVNPETRALFKSDRSLTARVVHTVAAVLWGSIGRLPSAGAVIQFNHSVPWALATLLGGAGPNIWSSFKLIGELAEKATDCGCLTSASEVELRRMRRQMLGTLHQCRQAVLGMNSGQRCDFFSAIVILNTGGSALNKVRRVFRAFALAEQEHLRAGGAESPAVVWTRRAANVVMAVPATLLLLESMLLSYTASRTYSDNEFVNWTVGALGASADIYITYQVHYYVTNMVVNRIAKHFGKVKVERTFTETLYPKLQLLLDLLALGLAMLPFAELVAIAQQCATADVYLHGLAKRIVDDTFVYGSYVGWTVLLFQAIEDLIVESGLRALAKSPCGGADARNAALILDRLEELSHLIENCNPQQLAMGLVDLLPEDSERQPLLTSLEGLSGVEQGRIEQ